MLGTPRRALGLALLALACREPNAGSGPDGAAPAPAAATLAAPAVAQVDRPSDAPPAVPGAPEASPAAPAPADAAVPLPVSRAQAVEPGESLVTLQGGAEAVVDAKAKFRVELGRPVRDARLVLLDARDAQVPASEVREVGASTLLELTPTPALRPGSKYLLRVEGADGGPLRDAEGRTYVPLAVPIVVAGTPPPEPPARPAPKHRKRHR